MIPHVTEHHVPDNLMISYATGALSEALSLVVAMHISFCDECRSTLLTYEAIGGALIEMRWIIWMEA